MSDDLIELKTLDGRYQPFKPFAEWLSATLNTDRIEAHKVVLNQESEGLDQSVLKRAFDVVKRTAAVETGALEDLYEIDKGITITFAAQGAAVEQSFSGESERTKLLIKSQLHAFDQVLDLVTGQRPIAEAWIRELHATLCEHQETYSVQTPAGEQQQLLPKGIYKANPNHVIQPDKTTHSYAPVADTAPEMGRLMKELQGDLFLHAAPVVQAAYAHHAFTAIHPFADGNGRVARALASVFAYRDLGIPLIILADQRTPYRFALKEADEGRLQEFVDFISDRWVQGIQMVVQSLRAAKVPALAEAALALKGVYRTRGGFRHTEVDAAAISGLGLLESEIRGALTILDGDDPIKVNVSLKKMEFEKTPPEYRMPANGSNTIILDFRMGEPADVAAQFLLTVTVPRNCGMFDEIRLVEIRTQSVVTIAIRSLMPVPDMVARIQAKIFAQTVVAKMLAAVQALAEKRIAERGY